MLERGRRLGEWIAGSVRRAAMVWGAATLVLLVALSGAPGISRDEAAVLEASAASLGVGQPPPPAPPLPAALARATRAVLSPLGVATLRGARAATAVEGALLSAGIVALAWEIGGPAVALLAPALFWAAPRNLHAGLVASPDLLLATLAVALALAWRRVTLEPDRRRRLRAALAAGVLFGAALATRADAWPLLAALALEAALVAALRVRPSAAGGPGSARTALAAMAVLGPLVLAISWPALFSSAAARSAALGVPAAGAAVHALGATAARGVLVAMFPLTMTALTVPLALLLALAAGLIHAAFRLGRAVAGRAPREEAGAELLLLALALVPLAAAAAGVAPRAGGVRPFLQAMPFLAVLGARALLSASQLAWPSRRAPLAASLALLVLWPAARASAHFHPSGGAAWNELAGGPPGAASMGLPRQEGGEAVVRLLEAIDARAPAGARIWWPTASPVAVRALSRDGRLRADLSVASSPEEADLAVVTLDRAGRDDEYRAWAAFRSARPVAGAYLDEVPLAFVYAAPGGWR